MQNNILEMTTDIQRFKRAFYNKHNKTIEIELEDISVIGKLNGVTPFKSS